MNIRITQIDGKLPNLALMAISAYHRRRGDQIYFTRDIERGLFEANYDAVYGSCIFKFARHRADRLKSAFPGAILGGTGMSEEDELGDLIQIGGQQAVDRKLAEDQVTLERALGLDSNPEVDYSLYPDFKASIGFTQRGCRLRCGFCVVRWKEGPNRSIGSINDLWRGPGYPKNIHLLDNDFFGQSEWRARVKELRDGKFRVCLNQGINVRLMDDEAAEALSTIEYRDDQFQKRTLYTAWDNIGDEEIFFRGVDRLERYGVPSKNLMAYMLIGRDKAEDWDRIWHRFNRMVEKGIRPYPMVFDRSRIDLLSFQRWVLTGLYRIVRWDEYRRSTKSAESVAAYLRI